MCPPERLTIAVVSDLHAYDKENYKDEDAPSFLDTSTPSGDPLLNPISGLEKLIKDKDISADVLFSAGDIGDKAKPSHIRFGWDMLQKIINVPKFVDFQL